MSSISRKFLNKHKQNETSHEYMTFKTALQSAFADPRSSDSVVRTLVDFSVTNARCRRRPVCTAPPVRQGQTLSLCVVKCQELENYPQHECTAVPCMLYLCLYTYSMYAYAVVSNAISYDDEEVLQSKTYSQALHGISFLILVYSWMQAGE